MGAAYTERRQPAADTVALAISFLTTVLLWRIYSYQAGGRIDTSFTDLPNRARRGGAGTARVLDWSHLIMVLGIVVTSAGTELAIRHPFDHQRWSWIAVIVGGPALFLVGRAVLGYVVFGYVSGPRVIGIVVLAAMTPAMILLPPLLVAAATSVVLLGVIAPDMPPLGKRLKTRQPAADTTVA
jgi:low temperature requirement protein LtrA